MASAAARETSTLLRATASSSVYGRRSRFVVGARPSRHATETTYLRRVVSDVAG